MSKRKRAERFIGKTIRSGSITITVEEVLVVDATSRLLHPWKERVLAFKGFALDRHGEKYEVVKCVSSRLRYNVIQ